MNHTTSAARTKRLRARRVERDGLRVARVSGQERDLYDRLGTRNHAGQSRRQTDAPIDGTARLPRRRRLGRRGHVGRLRRHPRGAPAQERSANGRAPARRPPGRSSPATSTSSSSACRLNENYNLRRLERYLSIVWASGAEPCVLLTKSDLADDPARYEAEVGMVAPGADVLVVTDKGEDGYAAVERKMAPGFTYAFVGSSGVGKSTIVNHLMDLSVMATAGLGKGDKGHHTTTSRQLFATPSGAYVIDTPGMRELQLDLVDFDAAFADVETLAAACKFNDCTHNNEPHCAVRAAIEDGRLPAERMENYRKMQKEAEHQARKERTAAIAAARWRRTH
ncbi:MAG: ribosome small subunit-dependent GTPase A [Bacillus subtilis]|nr:ribosome small subunit-dependent GTPase A [Bacillus subtilis]